ncbi:IS5 family transposase [Streptomyces sp. V4I2]|uniref:IS5 family transposase n=1 Tax=Streptomyces sp. V4I2 TaxID=3042280 RepID=UPI00277E7ACB|nr:IS5 family transposase [Streptomyces sp. V4I2]MDQ1046304.1 transposase [Streptomyces sp. V4I2]
MARGDLTDEQWALIEPHLPIAAVGPIPDLRKHFNAVMWRFRTGSPWRDLPTEFGPWQSAYDRFRIWATRGVFQDLMHTVIAEAAARGQADLGLVSVDSATARAHHHAAGMALVTATATAPIGPGRRSTRSVHCHPPSAWSGTSKTSVSGSGTGCRPAALVGQHVRQLPAFFAHGQQQQPEVVRLLVHLSPGEIAGVVPHPGEGRKDASRYVHRNPEVVDPITDDVLAEGEEGEVVFTSLTKEALPIIRYRTRDLTRLLPGTARPAFRRIQKITGRCDDMIILRGVNVFPSQIEEIVLRTPGVAPHFQVQLTRRGRMDHMTVRVEARPGTRTELRETAAKAIGQSVKDGVGVTVDVAIVDPETLERSLGKLRRVKDLRQQ